MTNFWDYNVWGFLNLFAVLLVSLLAANALKRAFRFLEASLIPTSVLAGALLLLASEAVRILTGTEIFETWFFNHNGIEMLELLTYHMLGLGFVASTFKSAGGKLGRKRTTEIFDTGVTTVSNYLIQGVLGLIISLIAAAVMTKGFFPAAGVLLPFGYGQGTGQAMNYGNIYETQYGFAGGKSFGLTIAALGFLSASIGGVIHLNILRRQGKIKPRQTEEGQLRSEQVQAANEIPMMDSIDKMTIQVAFVASAYLLAYLLMLGLGALLPGMKAVVYGFNFLLGVLAATLVKTTLRLLKKAGVVKRDYVNSFLMTRVSNFCFDLMVVAGIAAIRLGILQDYWGVILIMGVLGAVLTYFYNRLVSRKLFPAYEQEQFLMMYGMLTGTASTGTILLREIDSDFRTPAADNMVYQNFPAIVFGFPMMLLATLAPQKPVLTLLILIGFFLVMNLILFRSLIFRKKRKTEKQQ
jgi:ESS family glutamate:Na+ symporter